MTSTPLPEASVLSFNFIPYYETVKEYSTNNFITRACASLVDGAYNAERALGDGVAYYSSLAHKHTFGEAGFLANITRAAGRQIADFGQISGNFLNSTRAFIYDKSPSAPSFLKDSQVIGSLSGAANTAGTTFLGWLSSVTDFISTAGSTISSKGESISEHGASIHSFLLAVGKKIQTAHEKGSLYKVVPLTLGSIFAYFGAKNLARGTVGYDSIAIRKKMVGRAIHEKDLPFASRIALIRDSIIGTMPGKRRAIILSRAIADITLAALLIYPLFVKSPTPNTDVEKLASENFRDRYLDSAASLEPDAEEAHRLHTAAQMYLSQKKEFDFALGKPKIDPKIQCFVEETLNPIPKRLNVTSSGSLSERAYDLTFGQVSGFFAPCKSFATPGHKTIFSEAEDGSTLVNATRLAEACDARKMFVETSPKPLSIKFADFVGSACNATVGYTPWAGTCAEMREAIGKTIEEDRYLMQTGVTVMCDVLKNRGGNPLRLQRKFTALPGKEKPGLVEALSERKQEAEYIQQLVKDPAKLEQFATENGAELQRYLRGYFNISSESEFTTKALKEKYKAFALMAHPDRCPDKELLGDCQDLFAATGSLYDAFTKNPKLFEACKGNHASSGDHNYYYTTSEMWQNLKNAFNPYSDAASEETFPAGFKPPTFSELQRLA